MYHYTESGLQNVWLTNGYKTRQTEGGVAVAIVDAEGLHQAIGRHIAAKGRMTKEEFRFLRKELDLSQSRFAAWTGMSVDMVSKWERLGRVPKMACRFIQGIYLEKMDGNVKMTEMLERLADLDREDDGRLVFEDTSFGWKEAA
ncbi:MAG: transcriptional regulator [Rhodoferax sp.]|jgi:DNA-binding transcriptional regulator YiaG|nr:transcriptional regulator [Rhodoferax sp.]